MTERTGTTNNSEQYLEKLHDVIGELNNTFLQYCVVGGNAVYALTNHLPYIPKNYPDIDILALGPTNALIQHAYNSLKGAGRLHHPEVEIESATLSSEQALRTTTLCTSTRIDESGRHFLYYGKVEVEVPKETMEIHLADLKGIPIPCLPAKTTLFRYVARGGMVKPKDTFKIALLENHILQHWDEQPDDALYRPYLDFVQLVRDKYPLHVFAFSLIWNIDNLFSSRILGTNSYLYKIFRKLS